MKKSKARYYIFTFSCLFILFSILTGCSVDSNPIASSNSDNSASTFAVTDELSYEPYPPISHEDLATLIPGYEILTMDARATEGTLDDQTSRFFRRTQGGTVSHRNNGISFQPWQLLQDQTITVSTPDPSLPIVDFYPHPNWFNGHVRIWIDLSHVQLPPGRQWWELVMFYVDDNGNYERYWGYVDTQANQYVAWTNHFSRYILAITNEKSN